MWIVNTKIINTHVYSLNTVIGQQTIVEHISFFHAAMFSPTLNTWCREEITSPLSHQLLLNTYENIFLTSSLHHKNLCSTKNDIKSPHLLHNRTTVVTGCTLNIIPPNQYHPINTKMAFWRRRLITQIQVPFWEQARNSHLHLGGAN